MRSPTQLRLNLVALFAVVLVEIAPGTALAVGGGQATDEFPFVVAIDVAHDADPTVADHNCGAILITPTWLLTANHCLTGDYRGPSCGFAQGGPLDYEGIGRANVWLSAAPSFTPGSQDLTHTFGRSGRMWARLNIIDSCSSNDSARDIGLIQLDHRIPMTDVGSIAAGLPAITPIHVPRGSGLCRNVIDPDDFRGILVGYRYGNGRVRNDNVDFGWNMYVSVPTYVETLYQNAWGFLSPYGGAEGGDSGGALLSACGTLDCTPTLCGVISRRLPEINNFGIGTDTAAIDSDCNIGFMFGGGPASCTAGFYGNHILDSAGRFMGECDEGPESLRDIDTDDDLIPDACDVCRIAPSRDANGVNNYDLSGASSGDADGDGIPDACDNCPLTGNPTSLPQVATALSPQFDSDHDGVGDACDACPYSDKSIFLPQDLTCCDGANDPVCTGHKNGVANRCVAIPSVPASTPGLSPWYTTCANRFGRCAFPTDADDDGVPDSCDNCPNVPNPDQTDTDHDGVGDACDWCPGNDVYGDALGNEAIGCAFQAEPNGYCATATGQSGSVCAPLQWDPVSEGLIGGICTFGRDSDGDGVADGCDNCPGVFNPANGSGLQPDCNLDAEIAMGLPLLGDACDPTPCSYLSASAGLSNTPPDAADGWLKLTYAPVLLPSGKPGAYPTQGAVSVTVGTRQCPCVHGETDPLSCAMHSNCVLDSGHYAAAAGNPWTVSEVAASPSLTAPPPASPSAANFAPNGELTELAVSDPVPNDLKVKVPPVYADYYAGTTISVIHRALWAHVPGAVGLQVPSTEYVARSNHYDVIQFGSPIPLPGGSNTFSVLSPCRYLQCPLCPLLADTPNWSVDPEAGVVTARGIAQEITLVPAGSDPTLAGRLAESGVRWVPVAEPGLWLDADAPRVASLTADGSAVHAAIAYDGALFDALHPPDPNGDPPAPRSEFGAILSGRERAVYVVGGVLSSGALAGDIWSLDIASNSWSELAYHGPAPAKVLAATYRPVDRSLYVIDEVSVNILHIPFRYARMLRISLDSLESSVIYQGPRHLLVDAVYLTNGPQGELLVIAARSGGGTYRGLSLQVGSGGQLVAEKTLHGTGQIAFEPTLSAAGLTIPILTQGRVQARFIAGFPSSNEHFGVGDLL